MTNKPLKSSEYHRIGNLFLYMEDGELVIGIKQNETDDDVFLKVYLSMLECMALSKMLKLTFKSRY